MSSANVQSSSDFTLQISNCFKIQNSSKRLSCYDKTAQSTDELKTIENTKAQNQTDVTNDSEFKFPPLYADLEEPRLFVGLGNSHFLNKDFNTMLFGSGSKINIKTLKTKENSRYDLNVIGMVSSLFDVTSVGVLNNSGGVLINTDFILGAEITHSFLENSAIKFKYYHKSTHLGDEFLINNPFYLQNRVNLSFEAIEIVGFHRFNNVETYLGGSMIVRSEPRSLKKFKLQSGIQYKGEQYWGMTPIIGLDIKSWQANNWNPNLSLKAGIEFNPGFNKPLQLMLDVYNGQSPYGQFFKDDYRYLGISINHFW
jgi:hypothetical protein